MYVDVGDIRVVCHHSHRESVNFDCRINKNINVVDEYTIFKEERSVLADDIKLYGTGL